MCCPAAGSRMDHDLQGSLPTQIAQTRRRLITKSEHLHTWPISPARRTAAFGEKSAVTIEGQARPCGPCAALMNSSPRSAIPLMQLAEKLHFPSGKHLFVYGAVLKVRIHLSPAASPVRT
jgi:hypothetical protein